jgi:hypothetical protein
MPKKIRSFRRVSVLFLLFSVTTRVFTGAAEAQVNFTSLVIDHQVKQSDSVNHESLLHKSVLKDVESASSIPEKHHTYATYKKYLTPDSAFQVELTAIEREKVSAGPIDFIESSQPKLSTLLPLAHSPPSLTSNEVQMQMSYAPNVEAMENIYGEFEINNSTWGFGRL